MPVQSRTVAVVRHGATAVLEAVLVVAIATSLIIAVSVIGNRAPAGAGAALAGSGGSSSITLASVDGRTADGQPSLGATVSFATTYPRTVRNPRIEVLCRQDGELVYGMAGGVTDTFLLGGAWSLWLERGGAASCTANLYVFGQKAGRQTVTYLASTAFQAGG